MAVLGGGVARVQLPSSTLFCLELEDSFEVARDGGSEGMYLVVVVVMILMEIMIMIVVMVMTNLWQ